MLNRIWTAIVRTLRPSRRLFSRTALPVFAVGAILLAAGVYGAWRVHRLHKRGSEILSDNVASIRAAEELEKIARELRYRLKRHVSSGGERHLEHIEQMLPAAAEALEEAESLAKSAREQQRVQRMREGYERFRVDFGRISSQPTEEAQHQIILNLADEVLPNKLLVYTDRYIELNEQELDRSSRRNQSTANRLMFGLLLLGTCGGVAGLIAGYGIARLVNRTIVQLAIPLRDTAGKLSQVAGPVSIAAEPGFDDLESILKCVSDHATTVVERLQESERDRLRSEQLAALGQLAAGLAHELRNPLTSMKAILQLANEPNDLSPRDLEILREESDRLEHSVQSLLDFARPPRLHKSPTDLNTLLEQTAALARRRAQRQGILLDYAPPRDQVKLLADAAELRQVVLNLLLNAIDATTRGGSIRLECRLELADDVPVADASRIRERSGGNKRWHNGEHHEEMTEWSWVVIRVCDTGQGLPAELGERIFQPFVTTKETGTGLGLSICKQIVEAHGGQLDARNRDGGGAVFEVRLPQVWPAPETPSHRAGQVQRAAVGSGSRDVKADGGR